MNSIYNVILTMHLLSTYNFLSQECGDKTEGEKNAFTPSYNRMKKVNSLQLSLLVASAISL